MNKIQNKNINASVEFKNKNVIQRLNTSQKGRSNYIINFKGKLCDNQKNGINNTLYQKKLVNQNINDNNKTISSFLDEINYPRISCGVIRKKNLNENTRDYSIENRKNEIITELKNINLFKRISFRNKNNTNLIDYGHKTIATNILNNTLDVNRIEDESKSKIIFNQTINEFNKIDKNNKTKDILNGLNKNNSKKKNTTINIHRYKKMGIASEQMQSQNLNKVKNTQADKDLLYQKNKISYLFNRQNTNLNNTLK